MVEVLPIDEQTAPLSVRPAESISLIVETRDLVKRYGDFTAVDHRLVILDEPTLGLDPEAVNQLLDLIRAMTEEEHLTVLLSSHQLQQVQRICSRVGIFVKGKLIAHGSIGQLAERLAGGIRTLEVSAEPSGAELGELLRKIPGVVGVERDTEYWRVRATADVRPAIARGDGSRLVARPSASTRLRFGRNLPEILSDVTRTVEGDVMRGLAAVYRKELADHLGSRRFIILFILILFAGLSLVYVAAQSIRDQVSSSQDDVFSTAS